LEASAVLASGLPPGAGSAGAAEVARQQEVPAAAEAQQQAAELGAWVAAAVRQPGAAAQAGVAEVVPRQAAAEARDAAAAVLRPEEAAPVWRGRQRVALPSAAPSVCHRDRALPSLVPQPAAPSAHARRG
jgi:hypothetical protein